MPYKLPIPNLISSELLATGDTTALLTYDNDMFDDIALPSGIDKDSVINCILELHGHATLYHPDPFFMRRAIKAWSERRYPIWVKLLETTQYKYNPIYNYDRHETITEITTEKRETANDTSLSVSGTDNGTVTPNTQTEHKVSAENSGEYQPESLDSETGSTVSEASNTQESTGQNNTDESINRTWTRSNVTEGNIGVTTTQQMLEAEREIVNYSVIEVIANDYREHFCLDIY